MKVQDAPHDETTAERRDEVLKRMLNTPPKPRNLKDAKLGERAVTPKKSDCPRG